MNAPIVVGGKSPHSRPTQNRKPHGRSRLTNKKDLLPGVDGRTVIYRRFRDIASQVALDQGGLDQLSEARLQLVRRFAAAAVLAEQLEAALANGQEINVERHALLCSHADTVGAPHRHRPARQERHAGPARLPRRARDRGERGRAMRRVTLIDAMADPNLFAPWFRDPASWSAWRAFLSALFALPMPDEQLAIYNRCTGRAEPPTAPAAEGWLVCGRRAGKSFILALIAVFLATFYDYRRYLAPGERGSVIVIATNTRQARVIFRYIRALLTGVPMLKRMIERETADTFDLTDGVTIEVGTTSFKTVRGYTIVAALCDELAFWPTDDSAEPDYEVLNALRPGMVTIPNAMLLCASSPYARRGALWDAHRRHFGKDDDPILVWHADTRTMNPTVPQRVIDEAMERDPAWAAAEYGAQFRSDIESFVSREAVEACVALGVRERAPLSGLSYRPSSIRAAAAPTA